jgi:outer membrane protein assembly factor BamA
MSLAGMRQGIHKSRGGLIRSFVKEKNDRIEDITFSGDFFLFPEEAIFSIIESLKGKMLKREEIVETITSVYRAKRVESPGTTPDDFAESILKALES